jgi:hypothetical protein
VSERINSFPQHSWHLDVALGAGAPNLVLIPALLKGVVLVVSIVAGAPFCLKVVLVHHVRQKNPSHTDANLADLADPVLPALVEHAPSLSLRFGSPFSL